MAVDVTKLNAGIAAVEAKLTDLKTQIAALQAQIAAGPQTDPADQAAVDAAGDKLTADAAA